MRTQSCAFDTFERSLREIAIHRLVHFIRAEDRREAHRLWERFRGRSERVSREIAAAYHLLMRS